MTFILHGTDENRIQLKLDQLKKSQQIKDALVIYDCEKTDQQIILDEIDSISLFDDKKMIVLEHATFLSSKDTTKYNVDALLARFDVDHIVLVLIVPSEKLDSRKKIVKQCIEKATVYSCMPFDEKSIGAYIDQILNELHCRMDPDAKRYFAARCGTDPLRVKKELEKLSLFRDPIDLDAVKELMVIEPVDDVFKMVDALFEKNVLKLLAFYRNFCDLNMEPLALLALLASQIRFLFRIRVYLDAGYNQEKIVSLTHAHPYRVSLNIKKAGRFTSQQLLDQLDMLAYLDQQIKTGKVSKDDAFEMFALSLK